MRSHQSQVHNNSSKVVVECTVCGQDVERYKSALNDRAFCSKSCKSEGYSGTTHSDEVIERRVAPQREKVVVNCAFCSSEFERTPKRVERFDKQFCDRECKGKWRSENVRGSNHPRWSGGESGIDFIRKHISDECWGSTAQSVREDFDGICQLCGIESDDLDRSLDVHHIVPLNSGGINVEELLIPLCLDCHRTVETYTKDIVEPHLIPVQYR